MAGRLSARPLSLAPLGATSQYLVPLAQGGLAMPQDPRAYALKETIKDFAGGTIAVPPTGRTLDVKSRLDNGSGVIVTSDYDEIAALDAYPALKSVPVPKTTDKTKGSDR